MPKDVGQELLEWFKKHDKQDHLYAQQIDTRMAAIEENQKAINKKVTSLEKKLDPVVEGDIRAKWLATKLVTWIKVVSIILGIITATILIIREITGR